MAPPSASISFDQVAFADAADGGIAAHLAQGLDALREQQRAHAHPGRGQGSLGTGVTAAYHDDIEILRKTHGDSGGSAHRPSEKGGHSS